MSVMAMRFKKLSVVGLGILTILPALANTQFRVRKMTRTDVPRGKGQCDIRVRVDGEVEVSVRGDFVYMRTISGRDGRDDGSECNEPLPNRPVEGFRFEGIDGRGEVRLVSEPSRRTDYQAIVLIRDKDSGEDRYHFRLSWVIAGDPDRRFDHDDHDFDRHDHDDDRDGRRGLAWNNVLHFGGRGHGFSEITGYGTQQLSDANVDIDRGGRILVSFRTDSGRPLTISGSVIDFDPDSIRADVATNDSVRLRGTMRLARNQRGEVYKISLDATNGDQRLHLDWDRR
jgi:hypothetical protein